VGAAVVGQALLAGALQAGAAGLTDRGPATLVLVVGSDVADAGVQAHAVVLLEDGVELARCYRTAKMVMAASRKMVMRGEERRKKKSEVGVVGSRVCVPGPGADGGGAGWWLVVGRDLRCI
jgi:hypothetical protein